MDLKKIFEESLQYLDEETRLKTFKNWGFGNDMPCNVKKMAEAGFVFIGNRREPDAVKCFFCNKTLDGWEPKDNPWKEHLKHAPYCSFAKLQKPEDNVTLQQIIDLRRELSTKIVDSYVNDKLSGLSNIIKDLETYLKK